MRARRSALPAMAIAVACVIASTVDGRVMADARAAESRFFDSLARRAYTAGRYGEALEHFLDAYGAAPAQGTLFNVAVCAHLAGERALAWSSFEEYLAGDVHPARRAEAERRRQELRSALALVRVQTEPPGAVVYVGRVDQGAAGHTPVTLPIEDAGEVAIHVEAEGHHPETRSVRVEIGERVDVELSLRPRTGRLAPTIDPPEATLIAVPTRGGSPIAVQGGAELPVGRYRLRARAPGHREGHLEIWVREREVARPRIDLSRLPPPVGRLLVQTAPVGAMVRIDGRVAGPGPLALAEVSVGTHRIEVTAPGYRPFRTVVRVREGSAAYLEANLSADR